MLYASHSLTFLLKQATAISLQATKGKVSSWPPWKWLQGHLEDVIAKSPEQMIPNNPSWRCFQESGKNSCNLCIIFSRHPRSVQNGWCWQEDNLAGWLIILLLKAVRVLRELSNRCWIASPVVHPSLSVLIYRKRNTRRSAHSENVKNVSLPLIVILQVLTVLSPGTGPQGEVGLSH